LLNDLVGLITKHLKKGERIRIAGFGILQVRKRPARMGRDHTTAYGLRASCAASPLPSALNPLFDGANDLQAL